MTDPSIALSSFQSEFLLGNIKLQPCAFYPDLYVHLETFPDKTIRITYARLERKIVFAFVNFVKASPIEKTPCFQIGYAVPEAYQNRGIAKESIKMAITEFESGFRQAGVTSPFYIEAIVGAENKQSQRVAEQVISENPVAITDELTGTPAFQYLMLFK